MKAEERRGPGAPGSEAHEDQTIADQAGVRAQANADTLPVNDLADAALEYARHGWGVFPCIGKKPAGLLAPHGLKDASRDPERIAEWWRQYPKGNIGATPPEGCWVLDIDLYKNASLQSLIDRLATLGTPMQRSGGGGVHVLFEGEPPSARELKAIYGEGLDIKAHGKGYVVVAPSVHPDTGAFYAWERSFTLKAAPTPAWLSSDAPPERKDGEGDDAAADPDEPAARGLLRSNIPLAEVERALRVLSADCDNETWFGYFMAAELDHGEAAWPVLHEWSKTATLAGKYQGEAHCRAEFDRCRERNDKLAANSRPKTSATIIDAAREALASTPPEPASGRLRLYNPLRDPPKRIGYMIGAPVYLPDLAEQVMFYGGSDTFKSSTVQGFCVHMAAGVTLDGKAVAPRVVIYAAEEAPMLWDNNLHAWTMHFAKTLAPEVYAHAMKNLDDIGYLQRIDGNIEGLGEGRARELADLAREQMQRFGSTSRPVVVLDPIFEVMQGDENSSTDMRGYIAAGRVIQREAGALVVHVHHTGHSATDRERGSSALPASQFVRYRLRRENRLAYEVELHCVKHKAGAARTPSRWRVNMIELMPATDDSPEPAHGVVVEFIGEAAPIISKADVLAEHGANDMARLVQAYRSDPTIGKPRLAELLKYSTGKVEGLIKRAVEAGLVVKGGGAGRAGYSLTDAGRALADRTIVSADEEDDPLG